MKGGEINETQQTLLCAFCHFNRALTWRAICATVTLLSTCIETNIVTVQSDTLEGGLMHGATGGGSDG